MGQRWANDGPIMPKLEGRVGGGTTMGQSCQSWSKLLPAPPLLQLPDRRPDVDRARRVGANQRVVLEIEPHDPVLLTAWPRADEGVDLDRARR